MDPATIEQLKREWTGRRVAVTGSSPTLRRFADRTGTVITVNMNGKAIVQFEKTVDIGWYDLALSDLRAVIAPVPEEKAAPTSPRGAAPDKSGNATATPVPTSDVNPAAATSKPAKTASILELARRQGAAKVAGADASD